MWRLLPISYFFNSFWFLNYTIEQVVLNIYSSQCILFSFSVFLSLLSYACLFFYQYTVDSGLTGQNKRHCNHTSYSNAQPSFSNQVLYINLKLLKALNFTISNIFSIFLIFFMKYVFSISPFEHFFSRSRRLLIWFVHRYYIILVAKLLASK